MTGQPPEAHKLRFYIVMTTLIVAGIVFLLYLNNDEDFSLTSAIVGIVDKNETTEAPAEATTDAESLEQAFGKSARRNQREVELTVLFDQIPSIKQDAKVQDIEVNFDDLTTRISVNNDKLELNNLQQVILRIRDFSGNLDFDKVGFSLSGTAKAIEVNDIALSSKGEIKIAFDDLQYDSLSLDALELEEVSLPHGNGQLTVAEKLTYELEQDQLKVYFFEGKLVIDRVAADVLSMEGAAKGISVSGALLDLNLQ